MRLYFIYVIIFVLIIFFSEMLPKREEIAEMYSRLNDIVMATNEDMNFDIFQDKNQRIEFTDNVTNYNAVLYLDRNDKSSMTKVSIDLISRAIAARYKDDLKEIKYLTCYEKMINYAEVAGMI